MKKPPAETAPAADGPAPAVEQPVIEQQPKTGGSFTRQPDGTLVRNQED